MLLRMNSTLKSHCLPFFFCLLPSIDGCPPFDSHQPPQQQFMSLDCVCFGIDLICDPPWEEIDIIRSEYPSWETNTNLAEKDIVYQKLLMSAQIAQ